MSKAKYYLQNEVGKFGWVVLPSTNSSALNTSLTSVKWIKDPRIVKKELTEKQLFNNIKKELRNVVNRTSAI